MNKIDLLETLKLTGQKKSHLLQAASIASPWHSNKVAFFVRREGPCGEATGLGTRVL
jgi:hypothetical protein